MRARSNGGIESEVEVVQRAEFAEVGSFVASGDCALLAHVDFILENDFQELSVAQPASFGFLQAQLERAKRFREAQGVSILCDGVVGHSWMDGGRARSRSRSSDRGSKGDFGRRRSCLVSLGSPMRRWMSLSRRAPAFSVFCQAASMAVAVCFLNQIAKFHDGSKRFGSSPIKGGSGPTGRRLPRAAPPVLSTTRRRKALERSSRRRQEYG